MGINQSCVAVRESARLGSSDLAVAGPGLAGRVRVHRAEGLGW